MIAQLFIFSSEPQFAIRAVRLASLLQIRIWTNAEELRNVATGEWVGYRGHRWADRSRARATDMGASKRMNKQAPRLPSFERPPVVETVLGVEFEPLSWEVPHFGLFWQAVRERFPHFQVQPPIVDDDSAPRGLIIGTAPLHLRCWFLEDGRTKLIQVQRDRFVHNWRKVPTEEDYPRYEKTIRPAFLQEWETFRSFVVQLGLGEPVVKRCEVTYVNQLERGREWESTDDIGKLIRFVGWEPGGFLPTPAPKRFMLSFSLPDGQGSLDATLVEAIRNRDLQEIYQLTLRTSGSPVDGSLGGISAWMDMAHEWIVRGFTDMTTAAAHKKWGRTT